jgi:hypothetical protein
MRTVSIMLASRERPEFLIPMLRSVYKTVSDPNAVEVHIRIDNDDKVLIRQMDEISGMFPNMSVTFHVRERSEFLIRDYTNWMLQFTTGKFIQYVCDDVIYKTPHWESILNNEMEIYMRNKPDRIAYAWIQDGLKDRHGFNFSCFPIITREAVEALGYFMHNEIRGWTADIYIWQVYDRLKRVLDLSKIEIEHNSPHTGKRERDHSYYRMKMLNEKQEPIDYEKLVTGSMEVLKRKMAR